MKIFFRKSKFHKYLEMLNLFALLLLNNISFRNAKIDLSFCNNDLNLSFGCQ